MIRADRMAIAGFVCSVAVAVVTVLLILMTAVPSLAINAEEVMGLLLLAGAVLWVAGLVLSLRARKRAARHNRLARAGTIVSVITAILFLALFLIWLVLAIEWFMTDLFVVGTAIWGGPVPIH